MFVKPWLNRASIDVSQSHETPRGMQEHDRSFTHTQHQDARDFCDAKQLFALNGHVFKHTYA